MLTGSDGIGIGAVLFIGLLATLVPLTFLLADLSNREASRLRRRISRIAASEGNPRRSVESTPRASVRRDPGHGRLKELELLLRRVLPGRAKLQARLARTGLPINLAVYLLWSLGICILVLTGLMLMLRIPLLLAFPAAVLPGLLVPHVLVGLMISRRSNRFLQSLPEALDVIVRGLRSGLPVIESIAIIGEEFEEPIGTEFRSIADNVRFGRSIEEAVRDCADHLQIREFSFFAISIAIQRETGGNLTETLQNLSNLLRAREQMKLKIRALSGEARASAFIIGALPLVMLVLMRLVNPDYVSVFFEDVRGYVMIAVAAAVELVGVLVMAKMVRFRI